MSDQEIKEREVKGRSEQSEDSKAHFFLNLKNKRADGGGEYNTRRQGCHDDKGLTDSPLRNPMATLCVSFESYYLSRCVIYHKRQNRPAGLDGPLERGPG